MPNGAGERGAPAATEHGDARRWERPDEVSLVQLLSAMLRHRWLVLGLPLALALLLVGVGLVLPRTYTATASFLPQTGTEMDVSRLAGLAQQFGFNVPMGESGQSPGFYANLLTTRHILGQVVRTEFAVPGSESDTPVQRSLIEIYRIQEDSRDAAVAEAVERLAEDIRTEVDGETGMVEFSVTTSRADLSRDVARRMLALVHHFNLETRQSQALAERRFIEERLDEAERELEATEGQLQAFLERNRRYENSPSLRFEYERLQRQVGLQQQVYNSLSQSFEQAKIEEVRNTPVLTVVEPPIRPAEPDPRGLALKALIGLLLGGFLAVGLVAGREVVRETRRQTPDEYRELARLGRETRQELGSFWRGVRGLLTVRPRKSRVRPWTDPEGAD